MFRFSPLKDPRAALFGLTLFSHQNPNLEKQLEMFANILDATRNSLSIIRGEMHNFEASMLSAISAPNKSETDFVTKPVSEEDPPMSYTNPNYTEPASQTNTYQNQTYLSNENTIDFNSDDQAKESLQRIMEIHPDKMNDFLDDLERLIRKYR